MNTRSSQSGSRSLPTDDELVKSEEWCMSVSEEGQHLSVKSFLTLIKTRMEAFFAVLTLFSLISWSFLPTPLFCLNLFESLAVKGSCLCASHESWKTRPAKDLGSSLNRKIWLGNLVKRQILLPTLLALGKLTLLQKVWSQLKERQNQPG